MGRPLAWSLCVLLLLPACAPAGPVGQGLPGEQPQPVPAPPTPGATPAPRCGEDLAGAVEATLPLLDDPHAAEAAGPCIERLTPLLAAYLQTGTPGAVTAPHPFWPGARYSLRVEPGQPGGGGGPLLAADYTGLAGPLDEHGPVQEIVVLVSGDADTPEEQWERAVLRECVRVGQHLLRMGSLATEAGLPPECLVDANQLAQQHARRVGRRAEPLAYAVEMLHLRRAGAGRGLMYEFFDGLFPAAETAAQVVGAPGYGRWREAVAAYAAGGAGEPPYLRRPYLYLSVGVASGSPAVTGWLGEDCARELAEGYAEVLGEGTNPFEAYGTAGWGAWEAYVGEVGCVRGR